MHQVKNGARNNLISCLVTNLNARKKLLELHRGYYAVSPDEDKLIEKRLFPKEQALSYIKNFEKYITENADSIEALRIIYNSEETVITHSMLSELQDRLLSENRSFTPAKIWGNYKLLDTDSNVDELDISQNANALTNLIQIVRYAYKKES